MSEIIKDDEYWRRVLTPMEFSVLRQNGTEPAFSGEFTDTETQGTYSCRACGTALFTSNAKFHSGCGWPSFYAPTEDDAVVLIHDQSHGMQRTEVRCANCDSHLGHVFAGEGYPTPTDQRFCINSVCLVLDETTDQK